MHNNFLMGVKFWSSWGVAPTIFKITLLQWFFSKMVSNLMILEGIFETKFQGWFFFVPNNFYVDFFWKIEGEFNFLVNFFCHFKGNFYLKLYGYWKNGASGIRPKLQTFFSYVLTTGINERLIRKFNYTNVHVNIYMDGRWWVVSNFLVL